MANYKVKLTFTEPLLGTVPKNKDLYRDYIASKAPDSSNGEREVETVQEMEEKGWTGFHCEGGCPILYDYVIKGFFKDACSMLRRVGSTNSAKIAAHKKVIDGLVFVLPRQIQINTNGNELQIIERPLRANTAQGERVALAISDAAPAGSTIEFTVKILGGITKNVLTEWLDYGELRGLGQWRNASYGRFSYDLSKQ